MSEPIKERGPRPRRLRGRLRLAGRSTTCSPATATASTVVQNPTSRCRATPPPPGRSSTRWTGRSCWSATPTAARSSARRDQPERGGPGLRLRFRAGQGRVGQLADRRIPGRRAAAADPAAQGRLPVPRPGQVPRLVRRRPARRPGRVHGRLAGPVGRGRPGGHVTEPAWRTKPSWYMSRPQDQMIPPAAQRAMAQRTGATVTESASHSVYVSSRPVARSSSRPLRGQPAD